jgi:hypothetical protein
VSTDFVHVTARTCHRVVDLTDHRTSKWLWKRLRRAFPDALAAVIMPTHVHVLTPQSLPAEARRQLGSIISALRRSQLPAAANRWERASVTGTFAEPLKIARQIRYIVLNPCRARLVADPLTWPWSTHRDVMGAVIEPWVTAERIARALRRAGGSCFARQHHGYVSGDPSAQVAGTPPPIPHDGHGRTYSVSDALAAAVSSTRGCPTDVRRRGHVRRVFLALANNACWSTRDLSDICRISPAAVRRYLRMDVAIHPATLMCLGDARLLGLSPRNLTFS